MSHSIPTDGDIDVNIPPLVHDEEEEDDDETSPLGDYLADAERSFETLAPPVSSALAASIPNSLKRRRSSTRTSAEGSTRSSNAASVSGSSGPSAKPAPLVGASSSATSARAGVVAANSIGPRALGTPLRLPSPIRTTRATNDEFAERFKYLVASSGLLEKTQLYSTATSPDGAMLTALLSPSSATPDDSLKEMVAVRADAPAPPSSRGPLDAMTAEDGSMRWDIIAAIAVLMASLAYMIGPTKVVVTSAAIATGAAFLLPGRASPSRPASPAGSTTDDEPVTVPKPTSAARVMAALDRLLSESRSLDHAITSVLKLLAPRPDDTERGHDMRIALHRLLDDMTDHLASATSNLIPLADRSELTVLSTFYDIPVIPPRRRRPSTSDDSDVEWAHPHGATRSRRSHSSSAATPPPEVLRYALLSPNERARAKSPVRALATPFDPNDKFTKLPERILRHKRQSWSTDWSGSSPTSSISRSTDDRIPITEDDEANTSDILFSSESSNDGPSFPDLPNELLSPPPLIRPLALPFTPKRASPLAQALERLESPSLPRAPTPPFPVLSTRPSQSPFRRSLQDIPYIPSPPASTHEAAADLAKARASANMSSAKRRSLQAPFSPPPSEITARDQAIMAAGASLQRAKSLPQSDLARLRPLRTAIAPITPSTPGQRASLLFETGRRGTPGHSRTGSRVGVDTDIVNLPHPGFRFEPPTATSTPNKRLIPLSFDSPRPSGSQRERADMMSLGFGHAASLGRIQQPPLRVPSVSPLTLQGLKASCLGVHLKRRRVACCLLGLKFATPHDGSTQYWDDVCSTLHTLSNTMAEGRATLESLLASASNDLAAAATIAAIIAPDTSVLTPPRNTGPTYISRAGGDFAPRDSTEQALMVSIDDLQRTLAHVWARCDEMRTATAAGAFSNPDATWSDIRSDVGNMLRIIERGREAVAPREEEEVEVLDDSLDESYDDHDRTGSPTPNADIAIPLPEFVRTWERTVTPEPKLEAEPHVEALPPPGVDEVYEADVPPEPPRTRSTLSREERINLQKQARALGMTLSQLTAAQAGETIKPKRESQVLKAAHGEVMSELAGMFGTIRARKGMSAEPDV
ncbi:hypothetical protein Q8F55_008667 [Vanrija albida]|uniref:Myosin-binding domain-containing protein n=1 Tax=Vanrija albida TaxID=181172 RepID=A0ABR3PRF9_9TREE